MASAEGAHDADALRRVVHAARQWQAASSGVLVVAIDGHGGAGKSTLAAAVAQAAGAALVHTDDFFRSPARRGGGQALAQYYDWRRMRAEAVQPLKAGRHATFRRFDWERGTGLDGTVTIAPAALIVVEGVLSAAPELSDLVDRSVLVVTPEPQRLRRLRARLAPEEWDPDWLVAEQAYFAACRPPSSFDLAVSGTAINPPASSR